MTLPHRYRRPARRPITRWDRKSVTRSPIGPPGSFLRDGKACQAAPRGERGVAKTGESRKREGVRQVFPNHDEVDPIDAYGRLDRLPDGRPRVRLNMIGSLDGAAALAGRSGALGGSADKALFAVLRSLADVILVGAGTVRAEKYGPPHLDDEARGRRREAGLPEVPEIAVVTRSCHLEWESKFFTEAQRRPVVVTVAGADEASRRRADAVADVLLAGDDDVDLAQAVQLLGERGHDNVLCEGGPGVAAQAAAAGVIDEVCLTVAPLVVGGDAHRILDGPEVDPAQRMHVVHVLEADSYLFMRYSRPPS
ncbi:MAG: pyrimidine reductase family protein [Actinobacteria bacterium]|nr:pyrimidine reductase family protein [Actinomycetota bacterium]